MLNMRSCFLFMLSAYLSLSLSMLLSFAFLLHFPFTGLSLLWLKLVVVPILSLSLLGTPADDDVMNRMTGKRISNIYVSSLPFLSVKLIRLLWSILIDSFGVNLFIRFWKNWSSKAPLSPFCGIGCHLSSYKAFRSRSDKGMKNATVWGVWLAWLRINIWNSDSDKEVGSSNGRK